MATLFRPFTKPTLALRAALLLAVSLALPLAGNVERAAAVVTEVGSGPEAVTVGLQPHNGTSIFEGAESAPTFQNEVGNPVMHSTNTYAIYWDPTDTYHGDWQHLINRFLQNLGASSGSLDSVFTVDTQYLDKNNIRAPYLSTFRGAYTDTDAYPTAVCTDPEPLQPLDRITCLTDQQMRTELQEFVGQHALQKGMSTIFYLLTPPGVTVCLDGGGMTGHCSDSEPEPSTSYSNSFCSYHAAITPTNPGTGDANTLIYAVIPWAVGGKGDHHLLNADRTPGYDCQDGGWDPATEPIEQREKPKEKTAREIKELEEKTLEEQDKQKEAEALEGPHQEEPNQIGKGADGSFDTGLADLIINQIAVEQQNATTNPLLNAWQDSQDLEVTDECRNFFASGTLGGSVDANKETGAGTLYNQTLNGTNYYLNNTFNLSVLTLPYPGIPCLGGIDLLPQFTSPNTVNAGDLVGFDGMESDVTLDAGTDFTAAGTPHTTYAVYRWNFGDGSPEVFGYAPGAPSVNSPGVSPCAAPWEAPCAASAFHAYQYGGTYEVRLTVTDVGGNTASIVHDVTVAGPASPASESGGGSSSSGTGGSSATGGSPLTQGVASAPIVTDFVASKSLKKVLSSGLAVRYSANEQVAGSLQVLLDRTTAKRLGLHGSTATGLPKGSPRSIVLGSSVLVTTKAGKGTIRIKFPSRTTTHLAHVRKLRLTLRLVARNASRSNPQTTTVLTTVVLSG